MKKWMSLFSLLFSFVLFTECASSPRVEGAKIHMRDGRYEKADSLLREEIKVNPANAEAYFYLGEVSIQLRRYKDAANAYWKAIEIDSSYLSKIKGKEELKYRVWVAFQYGGQEYIKENNYDSAVFFVEKATLIDPEKEASYALLGRIFIDEKKYDKAREVAEKLFHMKENSAEAYFILGKVDYFNKKWEKALKNFQNSAKYFKQELDAFVDNVLEQTGMKEEKIKVLLDSTRKANKMQEIEDVLKRMRVDEGMIKGLVQWIARYKGKEKEYTTSLLWESRAYSALKKFDKADSVLEICVEKTPNNMDVLYEKGYVLNILARHEESVKYLEKVVDSGYFGDDYFVYLLLGISYINLEKYDKAEAYLLKAKELAPEEPEIYQKLAILYSKKKDYDKAKEYLKIYEEKSKK